MNKNRIENIVFDLGGVLIGLNKQRSLNAFTEIGLISVEKDISHFSQSGLFRGIENGTITPTMFYDRLRERSGLHFSNEEFDKAWNLFIDDHIASEKLEMLEVLKGQYNLYLLSNTNEIHANCFEPMFLKPDGIGDIHYYFEKVFYSHILGLSKPSPAIFEKVIALSGIIPEKTLYIDDAIENIKTANSLGFFTLHIAFGTSVEALIWDKIEEINAIK